MPDRTPEIPNEIPDNDDPKRGRQPGPYGPYKPKPITQYTPKDALKKFGSTADARPFNLTARYSKRKEVIERVEKQKIWDALAIKDEKASSLGLGPDAGGGD